MINLGNKIRELRVNKGLTQEQLATALNLSPQAISKWETGGGYPDVATLPVLAGYFGVSLDAMFEYDPEEIEEKIQKVLYSSRGGLFGSDQSIQILLDGIAAYPSGYILKRELLWHYAERINRGEGSDLVEKALILGQQIIAECQDSFITLGVMGDMADIYVNTGRYEEGKKLIESMPYRYHLDIYDRMRCTVMFLKGQDSLHEAREWKRWAHQELYIVCEFEAKCFYDTGDYENALLSYEEAANLIAYFWRRDIPRAYNLLQSDLMEGLTTVKIAACLYRLGKYKECDETLDKAYSLLRSAISDEVWNKHEERFLNDYRQYYEEMGLNEYKPCPY